MQCSLRGLFWAFTLGFLTLAFVPDNGRAQIFQDDFGTSFSNIDGTKWPTTCRFSANNDNTTSGPCGDFFSNDYNYGLDGSGDYITTKDLAIPTGGATLTFDYSFNNSFGEPEIEVKSSAGCGFSSDYNNLSTLSNTSGICTSESIDLSAFAGQTIRIRFLSNTSFETFYFDDVEVSGSGGGGGGGTPAPATCATTTELSDRNTLFAVNNGIWDDCNTWNDGFNSGCLGWPRVFENFNIVIQSDVAVNSAISNSKKIGDAKEIYVENGSTLDFNASYGADGSFHSGAHMHVCGTVNFNSGSADFDEHTLLIKSGGVVNMNGGQADFDHIVIEDGGTLNLNGGEIRRSCGSSVTFGLEIQEGGLMNINSTSAEITALSCFTEYSLVDGTIDCKNNVTQSNRGNFLLGKVNVSSNQSTGLIRTQTAYIPQVEPVRDFDANFFGQNSDFGGTVEYYGSSLITLSSIDSRITYYDLEVNTSGDLSLGSGSFVPGFIDVGGRVILSGGNLHIDESKLQVRGGISYTGSHHLVGGPNAELIIYGNQTPVANFPDEEGFAFIPNPTISSQGANVDITQPELRFTATAGDPATIQRLRLQREDVVHLHSDLSVTERLELNEGKLRTYDGEGSIVRVTDPVDTAVTHRTTAFTLSYGYVSGTLERAVQPNTSYDFPVGYPDATSFAGADHRRLSLDIGSMSGYTAIRVNFIPGADPCDGSLAVSEDGLNYTKIHPEGKWDVTPVGTGSITYGARLYTHGFDPANLPADIYGPLKRPSGSTVCADWSVAGGTRPPAGGLGRVVLDDNGVDTSYAGRLGWTDFSEFAIGVQSNPPLAIDGLNFKAELLANGSDANLSWLYDGRQAWQSLAVEHRSPETQDFRLLHDAGPGEEARSGDFRHPDLSEGRHLYRMRIVYSDGSVEFSDVAELKVTGEDQLYVTSPVRVGESMRLHCEGTCQLRQLRVLDLSGRVLMERRPGETTGTYELPTDNLGAGVYLLETQTGSGVSQHRVLVLE